MNMNVNRVRASRVLSAKDLKMRTEQDVTDIVSSFLDTAEGVVTHWIKYDKEIIL